MMAMHKVREYRLPMVGNMKLLAPCEVAGIYSESKNGAQETLRRCTLAVLHQGSDDDGERLLHDYHDFRIVVERQPRGVELILSNAPADAFRDGKMLRGVQELVASVLRDIVFLKTRFDDVVEPSGKVFQILRQAEVLNEEDPTVIVCWGGHSINKEEYLYSKQVGYELGLMDYDIATGCGPGVMKAPMKGALNGHHKQRKANGRFIGLTEPGIIMSEAPNAVVNKLVIFPDIEKRLEGFVRLGHGIIVFPGGVGTMEEILYLMGILSQPENAHIPFLVVFTGPESSRGYWEHIDGFLVTVFGAEIRNRYQLIINDPQGVVRHVSHELIRVKEFRRIQNDYVRYNSLIKIPREFQEPFVANHDQVATLRLDKNQEKGMLAVHLRRMYSAIVAGNVKPEGVKLIKERGKFQITGDPALMEDINQLLGNFIEQGRMRMSEGYEPCYEIIP